MHIFDSSYANFVFISDAFIYEHLVYFYDHLVFFMNVLVLPIGTNKNQRD